MRAVIVGFGSIGKRHGANLQGSGVRDIAVCDPDPEKRREAEARFGMRAVERLEEALQDHPDAVFVTSPPSSHIPIALEAARAGCHLFIEKPLSHSFEGIDDLKKEVAARRLVAMVGCNTRFHPNLLFMKGFLEEGRLGTIYAAHAEVGSFLPGWRPGTDYRLNYGARKALGGGVLLDAIHELDYLRWLVGEIIDVQCVAGKVSSLEIDTEDLALVLLRFTNGALGSLHLDYLQHPYCRGAKIIGEHGILSWDMNQQTVRFYDNRAGSWQDAHRVPSGFEPNQMYIEEARAFLSAVESRTPPFSGLDDAARVLELTLTCKEVASTASLPDAAVRGRSTRPTGKTVLMRVDASESVGAGHLMRCLALAEGLRERGFEPVFFTRTQHPEYLKAINHRGFSWTSLPERTPVDAEPDALAAFPNPETIAAVVVDRYDLPSDYFLSIRARQPHWTLAYLDDWGHAVEGVDLMINQNIDADEQQYQRHPGERAARIFAGTRFALLRSEFRQRPRPMANRHRAVSKILLTLGGSDRDNHTRRLLQAISSVDEAIEIHVVLGPGFQHHQDIAACADGSPRVRVWANVPDMYELMREMDLSVNGSGSTLWELYYMGLPNILYILGENQLKVAEVANAQGCSLCLGPIESFDPETFRQAVNRLIHSPEERVRISERARQAVDGLGVERVANEILSLCAREAELARIGS
ncbi:MAG: UDP-2,4-diacetamido-2,4,6-trideoxy-beta-L-altropyranose hydrolase [Candidatus Omnitrophota bacterium]|nr:UDP-2,4-diacetamido-2,4,6-trideoxy-beta-L-altropyranose hydrolase [Candidatus Omnitrophota bacterium]